MTFSSLAQRTTAKRNLSPKRFWIGTKRTFTQKPTSTATSVLRSSPPHFCWGRTLQKRTRGGPSETKLVFNASCVTKVLPKSQICWHILCAQRRQGYFWDRLQDSDLIFEWQHEHCGKRFISESILKYHTNDNHRELEFKYLKNPTAKDHTCPLCYIKFKSFYTMHNHILEAHKDDKDLLRAGEEIGEAQFACSTCEEKFVRPSILKYHENRIHRKHLKSVHSQKENKCKLCYREFNNSKHLSGQERIHQKDKAALGRQICDSELKFHCKEADCNKRFISDNILRYHLRTMHGEHVILEFRHLKKHGETAHNCPFCA